MAEEEADQRGGVQVNAVHLKLGALAGVVKEALLSSYEMACEGTGLQGSRLVIEEIPIVVDCPTCLAPRVLQSAQWFACPECKSPVSNVIQGRELEVVALNDLASIENIAYLLGHDTVYRDSRLDVAIAPEKSKHYLSVVRPAMGLRLSDDLPAFG